MRRGGEGGGGGGRGGFLSGGLREERKRSTREGFLIDAGGGWQRFVPEGGEELVA